MKLNKNNIEDIFLNEIQELEKYSFITETPFLYYKTLLKDVKENLLNKEFRITVVGEFSSGKSTFLNCLIGKDILPKGVNETTATITYVHNVAKSHPDCDKAIVHFTNTSKAKTIISFRENKNALNEFVSTISKQLNVAEEVQSVHLYTTFKGITENVVLIDTPGSNGTAKGHREIAIREIQNAHASLCLFHLRGFGESDLAYVKEISQYQKSIFYVMNFFDEIKKHEGESAETKLKEFKQQINKLVYQGKPNKAKVYGISALLGLVSKDHSITNLYNNSNEAELTFEKREELYSKSMIAPLELDLYSYVNSGDRVKTFYNSIGQKLQTLIADLHSLFEGKKEIAEAHINKTELNLVNKKLNYFNKKIEGNKEKVKTHLYAEQGDLEKSTLEIIKKELKETGNQIKLFVDRETLETLEIDIDHKYNDIVRLKIQVFQHKLTTILQNRLSEINSQIREHIHEYIPMVIVVKNGNLKFVNSANINFTNGEIETEKNKIDKKLYTLNRELEHQFSNKKRE
jgi:GTPase SAR1 family protein